ncbi:DNA-binding response regulator [Marispirochaeta aestuarii]|uniref:DNA-binding response regulator n=1 Tax=Marispirochaeta aestuarii TaxID=1963862 RepID=A0A1Y1RXA7_9SPIO|nr:response regulator [Marispirochaeta aestuarii]ORC34313.1 DNA-binding response regulator [Marispirochaeta aestuarii]
MYSVFLVEDEIVTREGIRNSIPWDRTPYTLAGEAPDGEMALTVLQEVKPDILITDIKMPFMDGLTLSRIVKKDQPWIKIIILSGHDEFQYAKDAISIGIDEYLLKPVSSADMLATLEKVTRQIEEEKERITNIETLKMKIRSSQEVMREKWICDLVTGQLSSGDAIESARALGIDLIANSYVVMIVDVVPGSDTFSDYAVVKSIISSLVKEREEVLLFSPSLEKQGLIFKNLSRDSADDTVYSLAQAIRFETERNSGCRVSIGIGSMVSHVGEIVDSYADADRAVRYMSLTGKNKIIGVSDIQWSRRDNSRRKEEGPVVERLRFAAREEVDDIIDLYLDVFGRKSLDVADSSFFLLVYNDLIEIISGLVEEIEGDPQQAIPVSLQHDLGDSLADSSIPFRGQLRNLIEMWILYRDEHMNTRHNGIIRKAKNYIAENYMSQDMSLNTVASFVYVSPNHFSTIFSQEAGETFIEYLTNTRIENAKRLLSCSAMKCSDIAYEVGYSDPHYFSFIFKKNTGISPRDYRMTAVSRDPCACP